MYTAVESEWSMVVAGEERSLAELNIELVSPSFDGPQRFVVASERERAELDLDLY